MSWKKLDFWIPKNPVKVFLGANINNTIFKGAEKPLNVVSLKFKYDLAGRRIWCAAGDIYIAFISRLTAK